MSTGNDDNICRYLSLRNRFEFSLCNRPRIGFSVMFDFQNTVAAVGNGARIHQNGRPELVDRKRFVNVPAYDGQRFVLFNKGAREL